MTLFLIIGILIPIIYIMRLNIKQKTIRLKEMFNTVLLSIVGITIFSFIGVFVNHSHTQLYLLLISDIVTGTIFGLILSAIYKIYEYLSQSNRK
ncbi:putative membrane protein [Staphylococcus hominis]